MLYYYFGSKEALFLAVLEDTYADIRSAEKSCRCSTSRRPRASAGWSRFTWEYYLAHPEFLSLLNSENLHARAATCKRSRQVPRDELAADRDARRRCWRAARAPASFRGGVDALQLYISIAALSYFYLGNNHTLSAVFGRDLATPRSHAARLAHMTDLVLGYLRPTPRARHACAPTPRPPSPRPPIDGDRHAPR